MFHRFFISFLIWIWPAISPLGAQKKWDTTPYIETFDTLLRTGSGDLLPSGWFFVESGTNANALYAAGDGQANTGDTYSFGTSGSGERSFGALQSGSLVPTLGLGITHSGQRIITGLILRYTGEQWRLGALGRPDRLDVQISFDATSLMTGTWQEEDSLRFAAPISSGSIGSLDGNAPANRVRLQVTLTGLAIEPGATFYLRWRDANAAGADDGLGIDDFQMEAILESGTTVPQLRSFVPANGSLGVNIRETLKLDFSRSVRVGSGAILLRRVVDKTVDAIISPGQVLITGQAASFRVENLQLSTLYEVVVPPGFFTDLTGNPFPGTGAGIEWRFTTNAWPLFRYAFPNCASPQSEGWLTVSVSGDSIWRCTETGYGGRGGVTIQGFTPGLGSRENEDWLISPVLDLSRYEHPALTFALRTRFSGAPLRVWAVADSPVRPSAESASWKEVAVIYPDPRMEGWSVYPGLDLMAWRSANTYIAFQYKSDPVAGAAQIFLDEIGLENRQTPARPFGWLLHPDLIVFDQARAGRVTEARELALQLFNVRQPVAIKTSPPFSVGLPEGNASQSLTLRPEEVHGRRLVLQVRYGQSGAGFLDRGSVHLSTDSLELFRIRAFGNTLPLESTLDVVAWNINWFGSPASGFGPSDDDLAARQIRQAMERLDADLYFFSEVVDVQRFRRLVEGLGGYGVQVSDFCSNAADSLSPNYALGQKLAFVYRKSVVEPIQFRGMLRSSASAGANWASGRFPYLMEARIKGNAAFSGFSEPWVWVGLHGKSGATEADFTRRRAAAQELKDSLDRYYGNVPHVILGDFNDDMDESIVEGATKRESPYADFLREIGAKARYFSPSLSLSRAGYHSAVGYADMIDHMVIRAGLERNYLEGSVQVLEDIVRWIPQYAQTTSDHYPLWARFSGAEISTATMVRERDDFLHILGNPTAAVLRVALPEEAEDGQLTILGVGGQVRYRREIGSGEGLSRVLEIPLTGLPPGWYVVHYLSRKQEGVKQFVKY